MARRGETQGIGVEAREDVQRRVRKIRAAWQGRGPYLAGGGASDPKQTQDAAMAQKGGTRLV